MRLKEFYTFDNDEVVSNVYRKGKTWGVGPQAGFEFDYRICQINRCCPGALTLTGFTSGSILASKTRTENFQNIGIDTVLDVSDQHTWRLIPAFHARIGLNYGMCFTCFSTALEIGYEFNTYLRGLSRIGFTDESANALCFSDYYNFDLQGLYISAKFTF